MEEVLTTLLSDPDQRSISIVETELIAQASAGAPWFNNEDIT